MTSDVTDKTFHSDNIQKLQKFPEIYECWGPLTSSQNTRITTEWVKIYPSWLHKSTEVGMSCQPYVMTIYLCSHIHCSYFSHLLNILMENYWKVLHEQNDTEKKCQEQYINCDGNNQRNQFAISTCQIQ